MSRIRFVKEIGLFAFSRGRATCRWRTSWCKRYCYNRKFYRVNPRLGEFDELDDKFWRETSAEEFAVAIPSGIERFRFAVRGEIWIDLKDVMKVRRVLKARPDTLFWIPTRAWQVMRMQEPIEDLIMPLPNARVMASIDPTTSTYTFNALGRRGWSTVFSGDNEDPRQMQLFDISGSGRFSEKKTASMVHCEKTWHHAAGHCAGCTDGCFSCERVDVHLKRHR